jgi:hypothetical protein
MKCDKVTGVDDLKTRIPADGRWHQFSVWLKVEDGDLFIATGKLNAIMDIHGSVG